jgi:beta-fructofuranosidase
VTGRQTRPALHLTAEHGWINDPLGLTYHDGRYHLFFQYVPGQTDWGPNCHWGHATSDDLLHWRPESVALAPGDGDDGCWSGSIVMPPGQPAAMFYTTVDIPDVQIGRVRVAHPSDESWTTWNKTGSEFAELPEGLDAVAYRDPFVFHDGDTWRMLMGAGLQDGTATALVHSSTDLVHWTYDGPLASRHTSEATPLWMGAVWECPQLFPLGDKWVLTVSVWEPFIPHYEAYAIGSYADGRFLAEHWGRLTYGPCYYAGSTFTDSDGSRGLIYWLRGVDDADGQWASANSVPHLLALEGDTVVARPHHNVEALRGDGQVLTNGSVLPIETLADLEWILDSPSAAAHLELCDNDGELVLRLQTADGELRAQTPEGEWTMPLKGTAIRLLLDGPVCEVFNGAGTMALALPAVDGLRARASGAGHATAHSLAGGPLAVDAPASRLR